MGEEHLSPRHTPVSMGGLRSMEFVRQGDARRPLQTLDQLSRLSLALAELHDQQDRATQTAAAGDPPSC